MWDKQSRFTALVNSFSDDLYRFAYWLCQDVTQAEDLVQETFARTWRSLDSLRNTKAAKSWLFTTLRRENARRFERARLEMVDEDLDTIVETKQEYDTSTEAFVLRKALAGLTVEFREPLLLQVIGGYSCHEIAEQLGLSDSAVMTRLFRAKQTLRETLADNKHTRFNVKTP